MTYTYNGWEGQTNAATVSTANSGASGTALNTVTPGAGATITYDNTHAAHGSMAMKFTPATAIASLVNQSIYNGLSMATYKYFWFDTAFTVATTIMQLRTAAGQTCNASMTTTGRINLQNSAGAAVSAGSFTLAFPLAQWVRVELTCFSDAAAGTASLAYFLGDSPTPVESTGVQTALNTRGGNHTIEQWGKITASTYTAPFWVDDTSAQDTSTQMPLLPGQKMPSLLPTPRAALIRASTR